MSSRTLWGIVLMFCTAAIAGGFVYSLRAPGGQVLPLLVAIPFVILAGIAWRHLFRS